MLVRDVIAAVDRLAPFDLAEPWDHVGLQVGAPGDEVASVLVALEVDDAALDEAARLGCGLVLAHHPLIFSPLERLTDEDPAARVALRAARERVAVLVAHTNLDKAHGGMADVVAAMLGLEAAAPLAPAAADALKLVGFVPADDADLVRKALFAAGAGLIGEYEHCSWSVEGQGTFFGREGSAPKVGDAGRDETVSELRLEVVFPRRLRRRVTGAFVAAHPYEEPAFDVYPVENEIASLGLGRLGVLPAALPLAAFAADVAAVLGLRAVRYAGDPERLVRRVAVLPGSGAEAIARGVGQVADVLVTGDVKYHEARAAQAQGLALVDAPHGLTEQAAVLRWARTLADALGAGVAVESFVNPAVAVWYDDAEVPAAAVAAAPAARRLGGGGSRRASSRPRPLACRTPPPARRRSPRSPPAWPTATTPVTACTRTGARAAIPAPPGSARACSPPRARSSRSWPTSSVRRPTTWPSTRRCSAGSSWRSTTTCSASTSSSTASSWCARSTASTRSRTPA